jgi:protein-S-isoprenylcysteine O-methyltransferase Ste14
VKFIIQILTIALIVLGLFVMFSSSMVGGGLSGLIGVPLFIAGLALGVWQVARQRRLNS